MKKLLAMVLALVMTLSLAVSANAAFKDDKSISDDYAESVAVLNGMGVFKGYEDGSFKPEGNITRAEVATIIYRIYTADVAKNDKSGLYATYNKFSDMAGAGWAQGYIGYCANASLVKGYPDGTFKPSGKVTGYEVLAMILRAVGYDKNNEFSGADWALHVAQTAQQLGVLDNVAKTTDLNAPASRELVAELLFQGIQKAQVTYTPAFGYVTDKVISTKTNSLGEKNFKLASAAAADKWGRPATKWTYTTGDKATTFVEKPDLTYTKAVTECDVAHDAGLKVDTAYTLIVNGQTASTKYTVNLTDTKTTMGAQGRLFEVYDDTIVMIDTFLAKVTYVADITYDAQGHVKTPATITLEVYDSKTAPKTTALTLKDYDNNYGYAKDEYVLINAYTDATNSVTVSGKVYNNNKQYAEIVSKATSVDGAQSVIYWNAQQHNVEGTVYDDAAKFYLDQAAQKDAKYTWYFDSYNNLIGAVEIAAATSYGVINSIWWAGNATDGSGVAKANVTYMDGTTAQVDISKMTYVYTTPATPTTPATKTVKSGDVTHSTGINALVMKADDQNKYFYVDTYINTNKVADTNGILNGHLFQFTTKSNGTLDAVEVATGTAAKLYNLADVAVSKNTQVYGGATGTLVVNSNTVFLVRSGADTTANPYTFKSITGFTNIDNYAKGEVDYVDLNGDNVADYVYVIAPTTTSKVTSLFYFDGQQGAYTLADGTWVVKGYVDGVAGEVKFANFDALQNTLKINGQTGYPVNNTLYVVTLEDGVVKSGHIVTDGEQLKGYANYPLSSAYNTYSDITINIVEGAAGTVEMNYSDRDTFADSLYHDYSANKYYSVVTDLTKVVGTMGNPADQHYYFVSIQNNGQLNALALQAYAYDKVKSGVDVPNAATVIGVALNANKDATVSLNDKNDAKKGDVYSVTLEQLRDNGYVTVGTFSGTVASDGDTSVTIELRGVIGAGTYKVTAGSYSSIMSFAN
ncbi:MAG TPA: S-layer homology domain-containing protein [Clostridiales bacterium]|nr:S-layer homology domain-containing protein [Clostridiales bacterium]